MNQQHLARTLIRLLGLIFIAHALTQLPINAVHLISMLKQKTVQPESWALESVPFGYLAVGLGLFWFGDRVADRIVARRAEQGTAPKRLRALDETALAILGLYILGEGTFAAARWSPMGLWIGAIIGIAMQVALGMALMLGPRGFVALRRLLGPRGFMALWRRLIAFRNRTKADVA